MTSPAIPKPVGARLRPRPLAFAFAASGLFAMSAGAACTVKSDARRAVLIELYTSEGCSDCPPADKWLSRFKLAPPSGATLVPLAYHVDYWDDLGWEDPFAQPEFGLRQRAELSRRHERSVFTPQIVVDGHTLLQWADEQAFSSRMETVARRPAGAQIALSVKPQSSGPWQASATVSGARYDATL